MTTTIKKSAKKGAARPKPNVNLRIDPDHIARAEQLAKRKGVTVSAIIQMALSEKLEHEDKLEREAK